MYLKLLSPDWGPIHSDLDVLMGIINILASFFIIISDVIKQHVFELELCLSGASYISFYDIFEYH